MLTVEELVTAVDGAVQLFCPEDAERLGRAGSQHQRPGEEAVVDHQSGERLRVGDQQADNALSTGAGLLFERKVASQALTSDFEGYAHTLNTDVRTRPDMT